MSVEDYLIEIIKGKNCVPFTCFKILNILKKKSKTAKEMSLEVNVGLSAVYKHLRYLKQIKRISIEKQGNKAGVYSIR